MLDDTVSANHPRKAVGAEAIYKIERNGISYDAQKLTLEEEVKFIDWWNVWNTRYSIEGSRYALLTDRHMEQAITDCEIMKKYFNGSKFAGGAPKEGEFGARSPIAEDLVGATDTEWGKTTLGTGAWAAAQSAWLCSVAQGVGDLTFAAAIAIMLYNGQQEWAWTFFGVESFADQPVVKRILIKLAGADLPIQNVEDKLRGSTQKIALFDKSFFIAPNKSVKVGVEVGVVAQDQIAPLPSIIWLTGTRAMDLTPLRPTAA